MIAEVIINSNVKNLNRKFDYIIPEELEAQAIVGARVLLPFGNKKELEEGYIVGIKETSEYLDKLKSIAKIESKLHLSDEKIELAKWMAHRYFCNISDCMKLMLPPGTTAKVMSNRVNDKTQNFVYLTKEADEIEADIESKKLKSEKQIRALKFLIENVENEILSTDLQMFADVTNAVLKTLEKNGYIEIVEKEVERNPFIHKVIEKSQNLVLNSEQQDAFDKINASLQFNEYDEFLLFGVTGSGKTEIYIRLIEEALKLGKDSIMLVPEISLTPQTVDRFLSRFGEEKIAVLHSKLSVGERYDQWKKIERGDAKIVIGARSAIFAPVQNLGLIIIDEEHDDSYKSEMSPRYSAKEIASYLGKQHNVPVVLGSATPDMTTYHDAINGKKELLELTKRANNASLPDIEIVDLRHELASGNKTMVSQKLHDEIEENLKNKNIHSILDLGCGTGALLKEIKELNIAEQLFGIDISPNMLEIAKNKLGNDATLILGDSERLPFEDSSFDAIVCNDSFHHYPQPDIVEKEVSRCLKQNGVFIIGDCWQPIGARQIMNYYMKHSNSGDVKIYSKKEMLLLLSKDFHEIEWKSFGTRSCLIIAYNN